jgi:hypothetical protein
MNSFILMLKKLFLFCIAFLVTVGALDFYLQSAEIQFLALGIYDEKRGFRLMPHQKYSFFKEGFSISETTNFGYYGKDIQIDKPTDTFRIALLGDSYVEGFQVFDRDHFRSILQKNLAESYGHRVEVMNLGMSGFSLSDEYCYYSRFVKSLHPDLVIIVMRQSDLELKKKSVTQPYCYIENDLLKVDESYLQSRQFQKKVKTQFFRGKTAVGDIFSNCRKLIKLGQYKSILFGKFANISPELPEHKIKNEFLVPDVNRRILEDLQQENVVIAYFGEMGSDSIAVLKPFADHLIDLNKPLDRLREQNINPNFWKATNREGHWNHEAHLAIGKYLAGRINEMISEEVLYE